MEGQFTNLKDREKSPKTPNLNSNFYVDIVVIGRNEGKLLEKSLASAIAVASKYESYGYPRPRIIYVDGKSTDGSTELAQKVGIETYIVEDCPNPAKGRHLGFSKCTGKYVLFLDGDTILYSDWLVHGIKYLEQNKTVAGVGGILNWEQWNNGKIKVKILNYRNVNCNGEKVIDGVGGTFLYRCEVLKKVGSWDRTLSRNEEFELHLRIAHAGYCLRRIFVPMANHIDNKTNSIKTFLKRQIASSDIFIPGIITRRAPKSRFVLELLFYRYWLYLLHPITVLGIMIFVFIYFYTKSMKWMIIGIITTIVLFVAHYFYKGKNFRRAFISIITMNFFSLGWIFGLIL